MTQIPILVLSLTYLAQAPVEQAPAEAAPAADVSAPLAEPKTSQPTEADKFLSQAADAIDRIEYLSARMLQTIHAGGRTIQATGLMKKGPGHRGRVDLSVDVAGAQGTRINASDGSTCYLYEKLFDQEACQTFDVRQVVPLLESRDMPPEFRQQRFMDLPFVSTADMLRGYQKTIQFESMSEGTVGETSPRAVVVVEGSWKSDWIPLVAQNPNVRSIDDLPAPVPQYLRVSIDKETNFPLSIELYRKDKQAEYKPIYRLDFLEVRTDKLEDSEFAFTCPENLTPVDVTSQLVDELGRLPEKPAKLAPSVAEPLQPDKP